MQLRFAPEYPLGAAVREAGLDEPGAARVSLVYCPLLAQLPELHACIKHVAIPGGACRPRTDLFKHAVKRLQLILEQHARIALFGNRGLERQDAFLGAGRLIEMQAGISGRPVDRRRCAVKKDDGQCRASCQQANRDRQETLVHATPSNLQPILTIRASNG